MQIECTQANLAKALQVVSRMVGTRGTLPVLGNVLLSIEKGRLKLAATDLEVGIQTWIGGKVESEGGLTVPARLLGDFIATNNDPTVTLKTDGTKLGLTSAHYTAHINGIDVSEFPLIPEIPRTNPITVSAKDLKEAVSQTVIAAAVDETRPVLTGVYLKVSGNELILAATDSYRLAERRLQLATNHPLVQVVVPSRTMQELGRLISDQLTEVTITIAENQILFTLGETEFISRLIDGSYPDYEQLIPKETTTSITVTKPDFTQTMKMASFFARESANNVQLKLAPESGMEVTAISPQLGDTVSQVAGTVTGEVLEVAFNAKFILDGLNIFPGSEVKIDLNGKLKPGLLRSPENPGYFYLIMPLRVDA